MHLSVSLSTFRDNIDKGNCGPRNANYSQNYFKNTY